MLAAKRALLAVLAERHALRQTAEAAAVPAAAAPSAAVHLKRPAAAVAAAPTAASKKAKVRWHHSQQQKKPVMTLLSSSRTLRCLATACRGVWCREKSPSKLQNSCRAQLLQNSSVDSP